MTHGHQPKPGPMPALPTGGSAVRPPAAAPGPAIDRLALAAHHASRELIEGLIDDAIATLHHDGDGEGEIFEYERGVLRRLFAARLESRKNPRTEPYEPYKPLIEGSI